jgi:hypothetical protein
MYTIPKHITWLFLCQLLNEIQWNLCVICKLMQNDWPLSQLQFVTFLQFFVNLDLDNELHLTVFYILIRG